MTRDGRAGVPRADQAPHPLAELRRRGGPARPDGRAEPVRHRRRPADPVRLPPLPALGQRLDDVDQLLRRVRPGGRRHHRRLPRGGAVEDATSASTSTSSSTAEPDFTRNSEAIGHLRRPVLRAGPLHRHARGVARTPTRTDEVAFNEYAAERFGFRVGQRLELGTCTPQTRSRHPTFFSAPPPGAGAHDATVVGIGLFPDEVLQDDGDRTTRLLLTPAYSEAAPDRRHLRAPGPRPGAGARTTSTP